MTKSGIFKLEFLTNYTRYSYKIYGATEPNTRLIHITKNPDSATAELLGTN